MTERDVRVSESSQVPTTRRSKSPDRCAVHCARPAVMGSGGLQSSQLQLTFRSHLCSAPGFGGHLGGLD